jgi:hypothetical protein
MKQETLERLSYEIDDMLINLSKKYNCSDLNLYSILIARMLRLSMNSDSFDDLKSIMAIATQHKEGKKVLQ